MSNSNEVMTINQVEEGIQAFLEGLRPNTTTPESLRKALSFLVPDGYRPIVELQGSDRKKRRTASADSWSPATDEIHIYFEQAKLPEAHASLGKGKASLTQQQKNPTSPATMQEKILSGATRQDLPLVPGYPDAISQLCEALDEVERGGRAFVALRWFRDEALLAKGFAWTGTTEQRQAVLSKAIDAGFVLTSRIPNPKAPMYPTTTIKLNRMGHTSIPEQRSRFRPVSIQGEPLSSTMSRDRGVR